MAGKASLTYYIFEGVLTGRANGQFFHIFAVSGGRAGSKTAGVVDSNVANNPYQVARQHPQNPSGGPLPPGSYTIAKPVANYHGKGRWAALTPRSGKGMFGRGGFAIHGRGPRGSDGCIVPLHSQDFNRLMDALEADNGGTLVVFDIMDGGLG